MINMITAFLLFPFFIILIVGNEKVALDSNIEKMEFLEKPVKIDMSKEYLENLGVFEYTHSEGRELIGHDKGVARNRNEEIYIGKPKESYSKYANQIEECMEYANIIYRYDAITKRYREKVAINLKSVEHRDNGTTVFRFSFLLQNIAFIYDANEKCVGYVTSGEWIVF